MTMFVVAFVTGLTTGGISCLAMQAGLLASTIASKEKIPTVQSTSSAPGGDWWWPVAMFLASKLVVHTIFGALLGLLGAVIALSDTSRLFFQAVAALFLFVTAMNLLDIHPIFRYMVLQPPRFVRRWLKQNQQSEQWFAPLLLGAMTVLIPCPVTQAMEINAMTTGNWWQGALLMLSFTLGTTPLFALFGAFTARLSQWWEAKFLKAIAIILILMAIYIGNGVLVVLDAPVTLQKIWQDVVLVFSGPPRDVASSTAPVIDGKQQVHIQALSDGYAPRYVRVKAGMPVQLTISTKDTYSCAVAFVFKQFGIKVLLSPNDSQKFVFTPNQRGRFTYACSMGMYTGTMEVI